MKPRVPSSLSLLLSWCTLTLSGKVWKGVAGGLFWAARNWDGGRWDGRRPLVLTRTWGLCSRLG